MKNFKNKQILKKVLNGSEKKWEFDFDIHTDTIYVIDRVANYDLRFSLTYDKNLVNYSSADRYTPEEGDYEFIPKSIDNVEVCWKDEEIEFSDIHNDELIEGLTNIICN